MKKRNTNKGNTESTQANPAIMGLIGAMQQQLASMEKKIDSLLNKSSSSQPQERRFPTLFTRNPQHSQPAPRREERKDNNFRERILHKAVCAECRKECEVPFKPTGDRPVYCKDCFSKRKSVGSFNPSVASPQPASAIAPVRRFEKAKSSEASRPERKKRAVVSRKRKRA